MKRTRLAVVMFSEISEFARLTSEHESRAIELLREHQTMAKPILEEHGGRIVDEDAGGMLVLFESALSAAQCALLMQFSLRARNNAADGGFRILPRIGLHLGDIWEEGERVYGNGINIASRVMNKARPGGICVSDDVYRQLVNKMEVEFTELFDADLKNISRSLALYELATGCESGAAPGSSKPVKTSLKKALQELNQDTASIRVSINRTQAATEGPPHGRKERLHPARRLEEMINKNKSSSSALTVGVILVAGFGSGLYFLPSGWWWVGIVIGLITTIAAFFDTLGSHRNLRRMRKKMPALIQEAILGYAKKCGGSMSVAEAAAVTRFTLDEVKRELESMANKGYAGRETAEDGLISYRFADKKK